MTRSITFAGPLAAGDCYQDGDLIGIDRKSRDPVSEWLDRFPGLPDLVSVVRDSYMAKLPAVKPAVRSPRKAVVVEAGWDVAFSGESIEDICGSPGFADLIAGFMPGEDVEAWLLPVTGMSFPFLVTPVLAP